MKHFSIALLICLVGTLCAQPDCLRTQKSCIESPAYIRPTVWVCTGDTLSVDTDANGQTVTTIDGFWICCNELTNDIWRWYGSMEREITPYDNMPVTNVSKEELNKFLDILNKSIHLNWRLPTREEWLFAFCGGIFGDTHTYAGSEHHAMVAWSKANSGNKLHPISERIPNDLDIFDMSGNAAEMVTVGDSIAFIGGCYIDNFGPDKKNKKEQGASPRVDFPTPPPEACGIRLVCHQPLKFNIYCERIY